MIDVNTKARHGHVSPQMDDWVAVRSGTAVNRRLFVRDRQLGRA